MPTNCSDLTKKSTSKLHDYLPAGVMYLKVTDSLPNSPGCTGKIRTSALLLTPANNYDLQVYNTPDGKRPGFDNLRSWTVDMNRNAGIDEIVCKLDQHEEQDCRDLHANGGKLCTSP